VLAATVGLRAESVGRVRMRLTEGLAGLVAERMRPQFVADAATHPRFKYFPEAGEDPYRSFLGVPIVERGLLQGVLVVQTIEARTFGAEDMRLLTMAGAQVSPIVTEARTLGQFVAPAHQRLGAWRRICGRPDTTTSSMSSIRCLAHARHNPGRPAQTGRAAGRGASRWRSTAVSTTSPPVGISQPRHTCSRTPASLARPVAYFGRVRHHESLPIYSGGLGILAGDHIKSASDLGIPLIGVGLYYDQGYFRQRLDRDGWQHEDYIDVDTGLPAPASPRASR
jgi:hypothetical protein